VTGAGGFIGSHLAEALLPITHVAAFVRYVSDGSVGFLENQRDRPNLTIHRGDLRDPDAFRKALEGCDTLFHLAAHISIPYGKVHPRSVFENNVTMTLNALQAATDVGVGRVVLVSTSEVYGTAQTVPITENHPLHPQSIYAASKVACDQLGLAWSRQVGGPEVVILRPFNTYGPRQSLRAVIPTIIQQALAGPVVRLGNTETTRDFVYVEDTVVALIAAGKAEAVSGEVVHVGSGVERSVSEVVGYVGDLLGTRLEVEAEEPRKRAPTEEVERLVADPSRAAELLGWKARTGLREGLEKTCRYFRENQLRRRSSYHL